MNDLISAYFERDLSEAEDKALLELLQASSEASQRFAALAALAYEATGAPEPLGGLPWWRRLSGQSRRWLLISALGLAVLWGWSILARTWQRPEISPSLKVQEEPFQVRAPQPEQEAKPAVRAPLRALPKAAASSSARRTTHPKTIAPSKDNSDRITRLAAVVNLPRAMPVQVDVVDSQGKALRRIFQGTSQAGKQRYEWDGRLENGGKALPGDYVLEVRAAGRVQRQKVRLTAGMRE